MPNHQATCTRNTVGGIPEDSPTPFAFLWVSDSRRTDTFVFIPLDTGSPGTTPSWWRSRSLRQQACTTVTYTRQVLCNHLKNRELLRWSIVIHNGARSINPLHRGPLGFVQARCARGRRFEPRECGTRPPLPLIAKIIGIFR